MGRAFEILVKGWLIISAAVYLFEMSDPHRREWLERFRWGAWLQEFLFVGALIAVCLVLFVGVSHCVEGVARQESVYDPQTDDFVYVSYFWGNLLAAVATCTVAALLLRKEHERLQNHGS